MCAACVLRGDRGGESKAGVAEVGCEGECSRGLGVCRLAAFIVGLLCSCLSAQGVVGGSPVPSSDRRFDAVGLLITDQPWAPCGGWVSGSCTLIGPNLVLLARHSVEDAQRRLPANGGRTIKVRFRRGVDGAANSHYGAGAAVDCAGGFQEIFIQTFQGNPWPGIDMVVGVLEQVPMGITPMAIAPSHVMTAGESITLAGWGFDGPCLGIGEAWTLRSDTGVLPSLQYSSWCCFDYNAASFTGVNCFSTPAGSDWVIGNLHDSGAPLLSPDPRNPMTLRVVGMVTSVTSAIKVSAWNDGGGIPVLNDTSPQLCASDLDRDGITDVGDLLLYVHSYLLGEVLGEVDGLPGLTPNDLFLYLNRYFSGC